VKIILESQYIVESFTRTLYGFSTNKCCGMKKISWKG